MIRNRTIYIVFLGCTIYLGIYRDGFVSSMLFYMALTIPFASLGHMLLTYTQFRLSETINRKAVVKGDSVIYRYQIDNHSHFIFSPMQIHFAESEVLFRDSVLAVDDQFVLYPNESRIVEKTVDCKYRGFYYIGIDYINICDFFGIFRAKFRVSEHQKILVYPLIRELAPTKFRKSVFEEAESIHSIEKESASIFSDIHEYRKGDAMRHIHWKLSSKKHQLMTKEFEGSTSSKTSILLNVDGLPFHYEENVVFQDYIIESIVSVVKYLLDNNASIDMLSYKTELKHVFGQNKVAFENFYEHLARMMFSQHGFEKHLLANHFDSCLLQSQVMIFTPYITESLYKFLLPKIGAGGNLVIFIVDPKESNLSKCFEEIDLDPMYRLIASGVTIYKINFENGTCRLDVA